MDPLATGRAGIWKQGQESIAASALLDSLTLSGEQVETQRPGDRAR
jgi:hypothetical protein